MRSTAPTLVIALFGALLTGCQQAPKGHDQLDAVPWTQTAIEHAVLYQQIYAAATPPVAACIGRPAVGRPRLAAARTDPPLSDQRSA